MSQLSAQVQIKASVDKLWEVLVDLDSLPQWALTMLAQKLDHKITKP